MHQSNFIFMKLISAQQYYVHTEHTESLQNPTINVECESTDSLMPLSTVSVFMKHAITEYVFVEISSVPNFVLTRRKM
jgi:hypothetical protein